MTDAKKWLKQLLPERYHGVLRRSYNLLHKKREDTGTNEAAVYENERILNSIDFRKDAVIKTLTQNGYAYDDGKVSWHYHVFAGWHDFCSRNGVEVENILEIGTHDGSFSNFLSKVFVNSRIFTIDLPSDDIQFINSYDREGIKERDDFLKRRNRNLGSDNINFFELNSTNLLKNFKDIKFDAIWIDGDHHNPQVTIDILNCMSLLSLDGILCTDDVIKDPHHQRTDYVSNESFATLDHLEKNDVFENYYFIKRTRNTDKKFHKYVSLSKFRRH